jgi:putative hydrolase of the HAD superfamily
LSGIVDNWNSMLHSFVEKSAFKGMFGLVISGGELRVRKPNKEIFEKALKLAGVGAEETRYIGNRYIDDVIGPQNASIVPIMYDYDRKHLGEKFLRIYSFKQMLR